MRVTIFSSVSGTEATAFDIPWDELAARCANPPEYASKQSCPLIKLAAFGTAPSAKGSMRHDTNVLAVTGVEGDYDAGRVSPSTAAALLTFAGIEALVYTSPSHTAAAPRWRVLAPFATEHTPDERRALCGRVNGALGGILAPESFTLSQSFYVGRVVGAEFEAHRSPGAPVDTLVALPSVVPVQIATASYTGPVRTDADIGELRSALWAVDADDRTDWIAMGQALVCLGDAGFALWSEWSATSDKYDANEAAYRWGGFTGERTGFAGVFARAQRNGWANPKAKPPLDLANVFKAAATGPVPVVGSTLATSEDQIKIFAGCTYVQSANEVLVPGGDLLDKARFDAIYGGYAFTLDQENAKMAKSAWDAFTRSQALRFPKAHDICFRPELAPGEVIEEAGRRLANIWWPVETACTEGDVTPFLTHIGKLFPNDNDRAIVLAYMAAVVQHRGVKFQWCPVIQGMEGNGKTLIISCLEQAVGERYTHLPNAQDLGNKFTGWLRGKLFIGVEEISASHKQEILEVLKPLITNRRGEIQGKGKDQVTGDNRANFIMCCNPKDAIPITVDKRRYAVFYTPQQSVPDLARDGMDGSYFPKLYAWLRSGGHARVTHWLRTYTIPDELNPATSLHRAPVTSSTAEAIRVSLGPVEQEIMEAIGRGDPGFSGGWISSIMLGRLLERRHISIRKQAEILLTLGYIHHPALPEGRVDNPVLPDGAKPRLFIKAGHLALNETRRAEVAKMYSTAQSANSATTSSSAAYASST